MGFSSFGSGLSKHTSVSQTNRVFPANLFVPGLDVGLGADQQPRTRLMAGFMQLGAGGSSVLDTEIARLPPVGAGNTAGRPGANGRAFERQGLFNVKDYGAVGNGSTDDRAAIQGAIDAVSSAGGIVYFPAGSYAVNCTTIGVVLPFGKHIVLVGDSASTSVAQAATRVIRTAGSAPLVQTDPAWVRTDASCKVSMVGIEWHGNASTGRVALLKGLGQVQFSRVRFCSTSTTVTVPGVALIRPWNIRFTDCDFHSMGSNETTAPAVLVDCLRVADGGQAGDNTNTLHFSNCEWETNRGADLRITGENTNKAAHIVVANCKLECAGSVGTGRTAPNVSLGLHNNVHFAANAFYLPNDSAAPNLRVDNVASNGATFASCGFDAPAGAPLIDQNGGSLACVGCFFGNWNATTAWDIASSVAAGRAQGAGNIYYNTTTANRYVDARAGGAGPTNTP